MSQQTQPCAQKFIAKNVLLQRMCSYMTINNIKKTSIVEMIESNHMVEHLQIPIIVNLLNTPNDTWLVLQGNELTTTPPSIYFWVSCHVSIHNKIKWLNFALVM